MLYTINVILISIMNIFAITYISSNILDYKIKLNIKSILTITISTIIIVLSNIYIRDNKIIMIINYITNYFLIKFICNQNKIKTLATTFLNTFILMFIECIYVVLLTFMTSINYDTSIFYNKILSNTIILISSCIFVKYFKNKIYKIIEKINTNRDLAFLMVTLIFVIILFVFIPSTYINGKYNILFLILDFLTIAVYIIFLLDIIKNKNKKIFNNLMNYANFTEQLLEQYKILNHENKNSLIVIKSMIISHKNNEAIKFIDKLIGDRQEILLLEEFENIGSTTLRGFLSIKYSKMKDKNIDVNIDIPNNLKEIDITKLISKNKVTDMYKILGIILDNAIDAASECDDKKITINIYSNDNEYVINIANTFNNDINLKNINKKGYSTKGKDRGIGLYILDETLKSNQIFEIKREIVKNIFYCEFKIKYEKVN